VVCELLKSELSSRGRAEVIQPLGKVGGAVGTIIQVLPFFLRLASLFQRHQEPHSAQLWGKSFN